MGRSVLIYVMGTFIILSVALMNANRSVDTAGTQSVTHMNTTKARNICNSMTSVLISRIADSTSLRYDTPVTEEFMGGTVTYQVKAVGSIGNTSNDDHQSNEHESDDHEDDHDGDDDHGDDHDGGDDHGDDHDGGDDHGDNHSANLINITNSQNSSLFSTSIFAVSSALLAFDDDHESDDHDGDDHEGDDHGGDDHDGHHHEDNEDESDGNPSNGDTLKIVVSATFASSTKTQTTYVAIAPPTTVNAVAVQGSVSARNAISTSGNMQVDGRNHDLNGNLVATSGTYGIWTTSTFSQGGSSDIGGTHSGTDYAPSKPANSHIIKTSATYPEGSYPDSPDKVFGGAASGFSEGTLKNLAISGASGGQYVTNPASLSTPFSGVTYVELASGETWQSMSISGTGILIVHNAAGNAIMKNLNSGTFKGILIADDIIHVHTTVIGAVVGLSSSPSEGNLLGNGNGSILYSSQALDQAKNVLQTNSTSNNFGFGKTRLTIVGYYD